MFDGSLPIAATFSKDPKMFAKGFEPQYLISGDRARVSAGDSRSYIDWISALGANLLGYSQPEFCERFIGQVWDGAGFSLPHKLERQVTEKLVNLLGSRVPGWTPEGLGVRFGLSGTDATAMAIRLAKTVTDRESFYSIGYHGWHEMFVQLTPPAWGTHVAGAGSLGGHSVEFSDEGLHRMECGWLAGSAALIVEQPLIEPPQGYYRRLRSICDKWKTLLIMDEVVTWPRWALGGASEYYGIQPDIICIAKALGNGIPISAIVGRKEYFEWFSRSDPCFVSSTGFGNAVSLAAADAVLDIWNQESVDHLWRIGQTLMDGLRETGYTVIGHPPRMLIQFRSLAHKTYFTLGMRDRGILWNRPTLPNLAHSQADVEMTLKAAQEIKSEMERVNVEELMADKLPMVLFEGR